MAFLHHALLREMHPAGKGTTNPGSGLTAGCTDATGVFCAVAL